MGIDIIGESLGFKVCAEAIFANQESVGRLWCCCDVSAYKYISGEQIRNSQR
jgi:hypothetical protein